jgi:hypothetical protein
MSVLQNFRALARYHVLTPVAVLAAFAAGPTVAADKVNNGTLVTDTVDANSSYTNNGTIAATGGPNAALTSTNPATFILNSTGARITTTTGNTAVFTNSLQSFRNDGTILGGSFGIFSNGRVSAFMNTGTITAPEANGIAVTNSAGGDTFVNSGVISGGSSNGTGVIYSSSPILDFNNSGTITASSFGVSSTGTTNRFVNTGTISSSGTAVNIGTSANTINSGVVSGGINSFNFVDGGSDRLTLLTGSDVRGQIRFQGGTDTLDFSGFYGTTVLTTDGQLETLVSGNRAFAATANNATITIFDQTGASSMGSVTSGSLGSIQTALANELGGFSAGNLFDPNAVSGYAAAPRQTSAEKAANEAVLSDLDVSDPSQGKVWGTAFGGVSGDSAPVALSNVYGGIVAGTHFQLDAQTRLGGLVGYSMSKFNVANGQQVIDSHTGTLGVYGKTDLGMIELNYALLGGGSSHSSSRQVVVGQNKENATASFASWFINPSLGLSIPVMSDGTSEINVAASASYIYGGVGSYTESSANFTANVGAVPISVFEARLELNGEKIIAPTAHGDVRIRGKVGVLAEANMGSSNIPLTLNGTATTFANPGTTTYGAYVGAGLSADIGSGLVLDAGVDFTARADGNNAASGKVSLIGSF